MCMCVCVCVNEIVFVVYGVCKCGVCVIVCGMCMFMFAACVSYLCPVCGVYVHVSRTRQIYQHIRL